MKKAQKILMSWVICLAVACFMPTTFTNSIGLTTNAEAATKIKLNPEKTTMPEGCYLQINVIGTSKPAIWSTSNPNVATVTNYGQIKAIAKGTATITATISGKRYKCVITVPTPNINKKTLNVFVGDTQTLKIMNTVKPITWSTSNTAIATINAKGKVTAKRKGTTIITATAGTNNYKCTVTVNAVNATHNTLKLNKTAITMYEGDNLWNGINYIGQNYTDCSQFYVCLRLLDAPENKVKWKSQNPAIATVNKKGNVTAKRFGTTTVTATYRGHTYSCKVYVKELRVYFKIKYTDPNYADQGGWAWDASFCGAVQEPIQYKITERTYNTSREFVCEKDITANCKLTQKVSGTFKINAKKGTITPLKKDTNQEDCTSDIYCILGTNKIYENGDISSVKQSLNRLIIKVFSGTREEWFHYLTLDSDSDDSLTKSFDIKLAPNPLDEDANTGTFTDDDRFIRNLDWDLCPMSKDKIKWESSDPTILSIDQNSISGSSPGWYNKVHVTVLKEGTVTVTAYYKDGNKQTKICSKEFKVYPNEIPE